MAGFLRGDNTLFYGRNEENDFAGKKHVQKQLNEILASTGKI